PFGDSKCSACAFRRHSLRRERRHIRAVAGLVGWRQRHDGVVGREEFLQPVSLPDEPVLFVELRPERLDLQDDLLLLACDYAKPGALFL
ncbi:hypothetical protein ACC690_37825, partial [Rhizobium johnstonii]|uniref:hypothetical protein n=1 Tax=Rhizobium johnstonii TaxID=3019933 RepID=UPI003F9C0399